jgi:hypothetical protein
MENKMENKVENKTFKKEPSDSPSSSPSLCQNRESDEQGFSSLVLPLNVDIHLSSSSVICNHLGAK